jgi:hypothetical protein
MKPTHFAVLLLVGFAAAQVQPPAAQPQQTKARPRPLQKSGIQNSNDNLFVWQRPFFVPKNLPVSRSATCSFKKGLSVGFSKPPSSNGKSEAPERISYSVSDENEADTVSFINLDTKTPIVQSNGGQASLIGAHLLRALGPTLRFPVWTEDLVFFVRQRQGSAEWCVPSVLAKYQVPRHHDRSVPKSDWRNVA